jgi:hypothetical protein
MPPPPSEWGKLSQGQRFQMFATDLYRAIEAAELGRIERMILGHVIELSWSVKNRSGKQWPDPLAARPNLPSLAAEWGVKRQNVHRACNNLIAKRILIEDEAGLWVNKSADQWVEPTSGKPLLDTQAIRYATSARTRNRGRTEGPGVIPRDDTASSPEMTSNHPPCHPQRLHGVIPRDDTASSPEMTRLIEERAAEDLRRFKRGAGRPAGTREDSQPHPEHEAPEADARTLFGNRFGDQVKAAAADIRRHVRGEEATPFAAYRAALAEIHRRERKGSPSTNRHARALKIAQGFADHGLPAPEAPQAPKPTLKERIAAIEASEAESRERDA